VVVSTHVFLNADKHVWWPNEELTTLKKHLRLQKNTPKPNYFKSHANKTTLLEVGFPTPFLIGSVYIDINLHEN